MGRNGLPICMVAVVAEIAVGKNHGVASGPHRHLPLVHDDALDIDEIDAATRRLRSNQRIPAE